MKRAEKQILDEAFRMRALQIAVLNACVCAYPKMTYETPTLHAEGCHANALLRSQLIADARRRELTGSLELAEKINELKGGHCALNCDCRFVDVALNNTANRGA